jgi:transcription termination factor Rho
VTSRAATRAGTVNRIRPAPATVGVVVVEAAVGVTGTTPPKKPWDGEPVAIDGYIDLRDEGYGFLRANGFKPSRTMLITVKQVRQFDLRKGDHLAGAPARPPQREEPALLSIESVNGRPPEEAKGAAHTSRTVTPLFPDEAVPRGRR